MESECRSECRWGQQKLSLSWGEHLWQIFPLLLFGYDAFWWSCWGITDKQKQLLLTEHAKPAITTLWEKGSLFLWKDEPFLFHNTQYCIGIQMKSKTQLISRSIHNHVVNEGDWKQKMFFLYMAYKYTNTHTKIWPIKDLAHRKDYSTSLCKSAE